MYIGWMSRGKSLLCRSLRLSFHRAFRGEGDEGC